MPRLIGKSRLPEWAMIIAAFFAMNNLPLLAAEVDGFTEPYRTINVSSPEQGVITELFVKEGDTVRQGQLLAILDMDVLEASREIAKAGKESMGRIKSATAMLELKKDRFKKLQELQAAGHAHPEEVLRARAELDVAESELLAANEEQHIKSLELTRIENQIERRKIVSPMDGYVTKIQKEVSEYIAATDPVVLTLVQCDKLKIIFPVPAAEVRRFSAGKKVPIRFSDDEHPTEGTIEFISHVTDPESGTVRVKVVLNNSQGRYRSGMACFLTTTPANQSPGSATDKNQ